MILVTGASGFLGGHLVRYLSGRGESIRALYNATIPVREDWSSNVEWLQCDLLDLYDVERAFEGITHVYHVAARVSFDPGDKNALIQYNAQTTANVVNYALSEGVSKLVYVSSIAALGRSSNGSLISEETEWSEEPHNSAYAISKYMAEMEVWRAMAEGLNAVIINPGIILGAGNWNEGSCRLMKLVADGFPFYSTGVNGWVDVRDVVNAMALLMQSDVHTERFVLCEGNYSYQSILWGMADALGKRRPPYQVKRWMSELLWRWNYIQFKITGKRSTVTKETVRTGHNSYSYDRGKFLAQFPDFKYTSIDATLRRMAESYMSALL